VPNAVIFLHRPRDPSVRRAATPFKGKQRWEQQAGFDTFDTADDTFKLVPDRVVGAESIMMTDDAEVPVVGATTSWSQRVWRQLRHKLPSQLPPNSALLLLLTSGSLITVLVAFTMVKRDKYIPLMEAGDAPNQ